MILSILKTLAIGIWIGAIVMLGIMAPTVFHLAPSRTLAGMLIGAVIERMNILEWVCACVALLAAASPLVRNWKHATRLRLVEFAAILFATALLCYYSMVVNPNLNDLRARIVDFEHPNTSTTYIQACADFDAGHKLSSTLVQVNMMLLLGCFVMGMVNGITRTAART
jgi:hypothetical protein